MSSIALAMAVQETVSKWNKAVDMALDDRPVEVSPVVIGTVGQSQWEPAVRKFGFCLGPDVPCRAENMLILLALANDLRDLGVFPV